MLCCFHWIWMLQVGNQLLRDISPLILFLGSPWLVTSLPTGYCKVQCVLCMDRCLKIAREARSSNSHLADFFLWLFRGLSNKLTANPALWLREEGMRPILPPIHDPMFIPQSELVVATYPDTDLTFCSIKSDWYLGACRGLSPNTPPCCLFHMERLEDQTPYSTKNIQSEVF